jgi:archaellum biogenesis ATPase FlaH
MLENTILANLLYNDDFSRKVIPYIKEEYFDDVATKKIFSSFLEYVTVYKEPPSLEALKITLDARKDLNEDLFKTVSKTIDELKTDAATNQEWLLTETEKFCQNKDLFNSIRKSILILDGQDSEQDKGSIPKLLSDSLGINFDSHVGHDYLEDGDSRYEFYHRKEERLPFDIDILNKITKGGLPRKSLSVFLAQTGAGKSLVMCHMAASSLMFGKNVLYITAEMAEERIAERIDANLLDVTIDALHDMPKATFDKKIERIKSKTQSKLVVKEYPTGVGHAGHFRHLLNELKLKKNFVPDIIFIDYLNICSSSRIKGAAAANTYVLVKSIAEEIRGLAMEFNLPIVSATQANRGGYDNTDMDLTNTSESIGLPATVDFMLALITSEELEKMGQIMIKQLKNRWGDLSYYKRFVVGIERSKMRIYDLEEAAQSNIQNEPKDDKPAFDRSKFASDDAFRTKTKKSYNVEGLK